MYFFFEAGWVAHVNQNEEIKAYLHVKHCFTNQRYFRKKLFIYG